MDPLLRYRQIDRGQIVLTIERLRNRINERFPDSGLGNVAGELISIAHQTSSLSEYFAKPNWAIRSATVLGYAAMLATIIFLATTIRFEFNVSGIADFFQGIEAAVSVLVFLGASMFFLATLETRLKRSKALPALHQLRSIAHIVDMHQLTKDPEHLALRAPSTASSPKRTMTPVELGRYLDYCSELLSLVSKLAALHMQYLNDAVVLDAVNDIEQLSNQLSNKIWQKITLLERIVEKPG
jgi:hypothetical protein